MRKNIEPAACLLLRIGKPTCSDLVRWIVGHMTRHETLRAYEWIDDLWYVEVRDGRIEEYPYNLLMAFTVNVSKDVIFWSNDKTQEPALRGGNCYCRADRWWRRLRKKFPFVQSDVRRNRTRDLVGKVYDYRSSERVTRKVVI